MTDLEDRVRLALHERADSIQEADLRSDPLSSELPPRTGSPSGPRPMRGWLLPLGAAAAIAAVVLTITVLRPGAHPGSTGPAGPPTASQPTPTATHETTPTTQRHPSGLIHAPLAVVAGEPTDLRDQGRHFDVGRLVGWNGKPDHMVIYLRRLKVAGVPDARIASHGWQLKPRTDMPYVGIGRARYAIPVTSDATFVYNACTFRSDPMNILLRPIRLPAVQFMSHVGYVSGFLVTLDERGAATEIQTDGGC